jgi:putative ABC transport system ATP-binding protein
VGLAERLHHYPTTLSGGEQQRVAVARAFVTNPKIIFADEMTGNLDTSTGEKITALLFSLNSEQNTTLVLVTHDNALAARCQRRLLLREGMIQNVENS